MPEAPLSVVLAQPDGAVQAPVDVAFHEQLVAAWLADLDRKVATRIRSQRTRDIYALMSRPWLTYLATVARTADPTQATVMAYAAAIASGGCSTGSGRPLAPATVNAMLSAVSSLYRYAANQGLYPDIAARVERPPVRRSGPLPALPHEEIKRLWDMADADVVAVRASLAANHRQHERLHRRVLGALRNRAILRMLYATAVRQVSLQRALIGDIDLDAAEFHHQAKGRNDKREVVPLNDACVAALRDYLAERRTVLPVEADRPLFCSHDRATEGHPLTTRSCSRAILAFLIRAGHVPLTQRGHVARPGRLSAHSIRRSSAARIVERHGLEAARELLGHASAETTRRMYAGIKQAETLKRAARDLQ